MFNPILQSPLRALLQKPRGRAFTPTQQALAILRRYGSDAHVYLPGANGAAVSGLLSNNYTLSDGSTGYSAVDGTAGLVLDAMGSVGAEFLPVMGNSTSYPFDTFSGSAGGFDGATLTAKIGGAVSTNTLSVTANLLYRLTLNVVSASRDLSIRLVTDRTGASGSALSGTYNVTGVGPKTIFIQATGTGAAYLQCNNGGPAIASYSVTGISVREITGIHATQTTTANKPAERRGLYNLLTYSQDLSNAIWVKEVGATASATSFTFSADPVSRIYRILTFAGTVTVVLKCDPADYGKQIYFGSWSSGVDGLHGGKSPLLTLNELGYAVYTYTGVVGGTNIGLIGTSSVTTFNNPSVGLFQGTLTAAQILAEGGIPLTTSAAASNPTAGRGWWGLDGNDQLVCASAPFQISDDFAIVVAANANTIAGSPGVLSVDDGGLTNAVALYLNNGVPTAYVMAGGTLQAASAGPAITAGSAYVFSLVKTGSSLKIRNNGVDGATISTVGVGAAAFTAMRIGYQAVGLAYWIGAIGAPIFIKGTVSDADLLTLERWVAANTPAGPSF